MKKRLEKRTSRKKSDCQSQLNFENCDFNFRCLLPQCYLHVVISSLLLLFVYQMWIVKCSVWILTIYLKFRGPSTPVAWFYRASLHLDTLYVAISTAQYVKCIQHYLNTSTFSQHTRQKKNRQKKWKNGFTLKKTIEITSEMELDYGWETISRKSKLSLHYLWSSMGSELKYISVFNWNMEKFGRRGSTYLEESLEDSHSLLETEKKWSLLVECTSRGDVLGN